MRSRGGVARFSISAVLIARPCVASSNPSWIPRPFASRRGRACRYRPVRIDQRRKRTGWDRSRRGCVPPPCAFPSSADCHLPHETDATRGEFILRRAGIARVVWPTREMSGGSPSLTMERSHDETPSFGPEFSAHTRSDRMSDARRYELAREIAVAQQTAASSTSVLIGPFAGGRASPPRPRDAPTTGPPSGRSFEFRGG